MCLFWCCDNTAVRKTVVTVTVWSHDSVCSSSLCQHPGCLVQTLHPRKHSGGQRQLCFGTVYLAVPSEKMLSKTHRCTAFPLNLHSASSSRRHQHAQCKQKVSQRAIFQSDGFPLRRYGSPCPERKRGKSFGKNALLFRWRTKDESCKLQEMIAAKIRV